MARALRRAWREGGVRTIIPAALVGLLQMLGGVPELILLTWLFVLVIHVGQLLQGGSSRIQMAARFVTVVALIGALAAIQLLPFLDFLAHSQRDPAFGKITQWSMPGWGWANWTTICWAE